MTPYRTQRIKVQAQALVFCAACIWMLTSVLSALPAMALHTQSSPNVSGYPDVATYSDYAYASAPEGAEVLVHKENSQWIVLCQSKQPLKGIELIERCHVPTAIARHLKVLKHKGMNHEIYLADL